MIDFSQVTEILLGNTPVEQVADSQGNVLWSASVDPSTVYFYVEDISGQPNTLTIKKTGNSAPSVTISYSLDNTVMWSNVSISTTARTIVIPANGKVYLKATTNTFGNNSGYNSLTNNKICRVGGNIMSLLYGDNFKGQTTFPSGSTLNFHSLFRNNTNLVSAENLVLPATTLADRCYYYMFKGCTSLTTAPALPATTLVGYCYYAMFYDCSLTTAPSLPATTLKEYCYYYMFYNCTKLNKVTTYATNISAEWCLGNWLYNVSNTGDFYNLGGATYTKDSNSGIPTGWTEHTSL